MNRLVMIAGTKERSKGCLSKALGSRRERATLVLTMLCQTIP